MTTFIRRAEVERRTGLKSSSIYERMAAGDFPRPIRIGPKAVAWDETEIADWQAERLAKRDAAAA
ncbi:AlpA family phage regulatory protein [Mesorhizobium sp. M0522]|uniref:helix-turn-helix transcriptional regulator n=1 Tax=unclassified Mesorhizobium TaxID=325217 RepID=UPI00333AFBAF